MANKVIVMEDKSEIQAARVQVATSAFTVRAAETNYKIKVVFLEMKPT